MKIEINKRLPTRNKELSEIFGLMSDFYKYLGPSERFRARAYENVSKMLANMKEPIENYDHEISNLDKLKDIGESIAQKIIEYIDTGKIKAYEDLKARVPFELFDMMKTEGIGPGTLRLIHDKLNINKKSELIEKIKNNRVNEIKGIGSKKLELLKKGLNILEEKKRFPLKQISLIAEDTLEKINDIPGIKKSVIAGSIRRKKENVGDIDIVISADGKSKNRIIEAITKLPCIDHTLAKGNTKASMILKKEKIQCDIRVVSENQFGAALLYFTGSKEHNIILRSIARKKGMKINEYGVFDIETNKQLGGETEEGIYNLTGLEYVKPEDRIGKHEFKQIKMNQT